MYEVVEHMNRFCECGTFGTFAFHNMLGAAAGLMASRVVVSSIELVSYLSVANAVEIKRYLLTNTAIPYQIQF
jgi:hypothetical protein